MTTDFLTGTVKGLGAMPHEYLFITKDNKRTRIGEFVYYTAFASQIPLHIKFYDFKTGKTREVAAVNKSPLVYYANLTASADGERLLYAQQDQTNAGIMLAELAE